MCADSDAEEEVTVDTITSEHQLADRHADDETVERELGAHGCETFTRLVRTWITLIYARPNPRCV